MVSKILYRGFTLTLNELRSWNKLFKRVECVSSNVFIHHFARNSPLTVLREHYMCSNNRMFDHKLCNLTSKNYFSSNAIEHNSNQIEANDNKDVVKITYIDRDGLKHVIEGKVGDNVMYLAQKHDLDVEGACEASLACCTCHVYVENHFNKLNEIDEEEEDMLDLAPFLQENSRLSCQIILSKELNDIVVRLPSATRNFYVDGHKPKPH